MLWIDLADNTSLVGCDACDLRWLFVEKDESLDYIRQHRHEYHFDTGKVIPLSGSFKDCRVKQFTLTV